MKKFGLLNTALRVFSIIVLIGLPGCWKRKSNQSVKKNKQSTTKVAYNVSSVESGIRSFFDDDMQEFTVQKDVTVSETIQDFTVDDFTLAPEEKLTDFGVVYFKFDSYELQEDQEAQIKKNVDLIKKMIAENKFFGDESDMPIIKISGHSCDSAGNPVYNMVLSEKRAKALADRLIQEGIPADCIKIIGYGSASPVIVDGKPLVGDRMQQAPNRRDEISIVYS